MNKEKVERLRELGKKMEKERRMPMSEGLEWSRLVTEMILELWDNSWCSEDNDPFAPPTPRQRERSVLKKDIKNDSYVD